MDHRILGIGYPPSEYKSTRQKWKQHDIEFADTAEQADRYLHENKYPFAVLHSRELDSILYINVIRAKENNMILCE